MHVFLVNYVKAIKSEQLAVFSFANVGNSV